MITALDTSVVLDVLTADARFAVQSERALREARSQGKLVVCECVVVELLPALGDKDRLLELFGDWHIEFSALDLRASLIAGGYFRTYLARSDTSSPRRVVPDFLIGAHAQIHADRLLARDRGYLRDYFEALTVWDPADSA